ncbi:PREDICTED: uncharacterized protein LOC103323728 [Prunus mume]|uniref:S-protein homolog n=1 Tax=Prunus mume TaxID=102107 RepID=A0ABM0NFD6_PRUMU|nr:PREDICTED: uncharacterized protein LOC103323728 [Prunus mume]
MNQLRVLLVTFLLGTIGVAAMPATQFRSSGGILDTHIRITNGLGPDVDLSIHCKSADDDLGEHLIHYETVYGFDFRIKIFGGTQFFCSFQWPGQFHWFDIFIQDRDNCENCAWLIKADGPRRFNSETRSYDDVYQWNE